jgi:hypothetical protein
VPARTLISPFGDDEGEMTTPADDFAAEEAFEALLAGRSVPGEAAGLAAFAGAVRASATQPGRPNAALAELLATGLLTDQSSPSTRTAVAAGNPPSRRARVRRRRFAMIFPVLLAKFLSAGAIAQAATGAGIVVVVVTGAGAAGVLPGPVQDSFSEIVGSETAPQAPAPEVPQAPAPEVPATVADDSAVAPEPETGADTAVVEPVDTTADDDATTQLTLAEWSAGPVEGQSFGEWVSFGAKCGYVDGQIISREAHERHIDWKQDDTDESDDAGSATGGTESSDDSSTGAAGAYDREDDGDRNRGSNGNGNGNGTHGGNGHGGRGHN